VIQVMEHLARQPANPLSLTEVALEADMNLATCLAVLTELTRAGWLIRDPVQKTYTLGTGALELGNAAEMSLPRLRYARVALAELHAAYGVGCAVVGVRDHHIEVLHYDGEPGDAGRRRVPFAAPFGPSFVAWADPESVEAWLRQSGNPVSADDRAWFAKVFSSIRQRRYGVDRLNDAVVQLRHLLADMAEDPLTEWIQPNVQHMLHQLGNRAQVVDELRPGERFPVNVLYAPVFDESGAPVLNISLHLVRDMAYEELAAAAGHLVSLATRVTLQSGGRLPEDSGREDGGGPVPEQALTVG
jgi:DNA-binding IclR family transcriptional regulator